MAQFYNPTVGVITVFDDVADHYRLPEQVATGWEELPDEGVDPQPQLPVDEPPATVEADPQIQEPDPAETGTKKSARGQ